MQTNTPNATQPITSLAIHQEFQAFVVVTYNAGLRRRVHQFDTLFDLAKALPDFTAWVKLHPNRSFEISGLDRQGRMTVFCEVEPSNKRVVGNTYPYHVTGKAL